MERIPASERNRETLKALMEGRSEATDGRSESALGGWARELVWIVAGFPVLPDFVHRRSRVRTTDRAE